MILSKRNFLRVESLAYYYFRLFILILYEKYLCEEERRCQRARVILPKHSGLCVEGLLDNLQGIFVL